MEQSWHEISGHPALLLGQQQPVQVEKLYSIRLHVKATVCPPIYASRLLADLPSAALGHYLHWFRIGKHVKTNLPSKRNDACKAGE